MRRTLEERKALLARLPWVTLLPSSAAEHRCEGIKWSTVALRDVYARGGKPARGIQDRSRCKRRGWFRFRALKPRGAYPPMPGTSGIYCYDHVAKQISDHQKEHERFVRWLEKNAPDWT